MNLKWRFGIIAGLFLALFSLYPQAKMFYNRGGDWQGNFAYNDIDEVAYSAYLRALIDGRPRKNDPYTGRDHSADTPQPESLFSIQFAAPYTIAIPARILGIGAPWAMTLSGVFAAFFAGLAVFWLIGLMTKDSWYAMTAALGVFCLGTLAAGEGAILEILFDRTSYPSFPGFRRYIPAMAFPAFFALLGLMWKLLNSKDYKLIYGGLGVLCFAYTVYSYFYVWTTAAAWLVSLIVIILLIRPENWKLWIRDLFVFGSACVVSMLPYVYLLSQRSGTMEHVQLLVHTRALDLFRFPVYIAFAVFILISATFVLKKTGFVKPEFDSLKNSQIIFALSFVLTIFAVFNQQVITGSSLQPIHYQVFIGNYLAALSLFSIAGYYLFNFANILSTTKLKVISGTIAAFAIFWGFVESHYTVRVLDWANEYRDSAYNVAQRLEDIGKQSADPHRSTVLVIDRVISDDLPTIAPQNVLWARHQHVFAGLTWQESKERYYQYLYYSDIEPDRLDHLLKTDFVSQIALFGWGRHTNRLTTESKPLSLGEISEEVRNYSNYIESFDGVNAYEPLIEFLIVPTKNVTTLENLEKWYEIDRGEVINDFSLFKLTPIK